MFNCQGFQSISALYKFPILKAKGNPCTGIGGRIRVVADSLKRSQHHSYLLFPYVHSDTIYETKFWKKVDKEQQESGLLLQTLRLPSSLLLISSSRSALLIMVWTASPGCLETCDWQQPCPSPPPPPGRSLTESYMFGGHLVEICVCVSSLGAPCRVSEDNKHADHITTALSGGGRRWVEVMLQRRKKAVGSAHEAGKE